MTADAITLPEKPAIAGLRFRPVRGVEDADGVYALRVGCAVPDSVDLRSTCEGLPSREDYRESFAQIAPGQPNPRLLAEISGQIVTYSVIDSWFEEDGRWVYLILGWVLPEWRGKGIGTAMLRWGEQTARQIAAVQNPGERFEFAGNASSVQHDSTALLLNEGYYVGYTVLDMKLEMREPPRMHPLPAGIEVRPVVPEHYPLIARSMGESYHNEYANDRFREAWNEEESAARLGDSAQDPTLWQIAWDGDAVVADVIPQIAKGRPELYDVSVRPGWRRKGLARALITRALSELYDRGLTVVRLHTTQEFPTRAVDVYRSVGFRVVKEFPRYRKPSS